MFIFEQVNQFSQPTFVTAVGSGFDEDRLRTLAKAAPRLVLIVEALPLRQAFSADRAHALRNRPHGSQAFFTDRQAGNVYQRASTETTIGRKQRGKERGGGAANTRNHGRQDSIRRLSIPGLGCPSWVRATAEDDPPSPSRDCGGSTGRIFISIAVRLFPAQFRFPQRLWIIPETDSLVTWSAHEHQPYVPPCPLWFSFCRSTACFQMPPAHHTCNMSAAHANLRRLKFL